MPPGVTVFDSASWNGIAIDSTCGGHGTCHKCKVRIDGDAVPITRHDVRTFSPDQIADGWRLACLVQATRDLAVEVPPLTTRPKAATVGVGRQVILRPALQKRYVELDEPTLSDQRTDLVRLTDAITDLELTADLHVLRRLATVLREADFKVTAVVVDEDLIDVEPGDTTGAAVRDRLRPRHHHRRRDPARPRHRHADRGRVDAQQAAAVRRRRDHPDQRHDDRPRARSAGCSRPPATPSPSSPGRSAARAASTRGTSTRWRSPATRR